MTMKLTVTKVHSMRGLWMDDARAFYRYPTLAAVSATESWTQANQAVTDWLWHKGLTAASVEARDPGGRSEKTIGRATVASPVI
jgi:hypothetical protein